MALTGEYDVVAEIGIGAINAIVGAVHENQDGRYPPMPHSLQLWVDDTHRGAGDPVPESERTGVASRVEVQVSTPTVSLPIDTIGVRPDIGPVAVHRAAAGGVARPPYGIVLPPWRPRQKLLTTEVRVRAWVRDGTSGRLPQFVHGRLFVTTAPVRTDVVGVGSFITMDRSSGPQVSFQPAAGTVITDEQRLAVAAVVRNVIRSDMEPPTFKLSLPPEVRHFDFELQPEARRPCISLLLNLTDRPVRPGAEASVTPGLLPDGADFAIAVGRDFILGTLRSNLFQNAGGTFRYSKWGVSASVRPNWGAASFDLEPGRIVFTLRGDGNISWWGVDDHFTFTVRMAFSLQVVGGRLELVAVGDPEVDLDDVAVGGGYLEGKAKSSIRDARDDALAAGASRIRDALDLTGPLAAILSSVSPKPPGVVVTRAEIRADGLVVSGTIGLAASGPVVVATVGRAGMDDALESWVPGGTIERFVWERSAWPRFPPTPSVRVEEHRFVSESTAVSVFERLCLRVEGTRVLAGGRVVPVSGSACFIFVPVIGGVADLAVGQPRPLFPLTEAVDGRGVRVIGHVDPWAPGRVPAKGHANLLLHFASGAAGEDLRRFAEAVKEIAEGATGERTPAVLAIAVVPEGGLGPCAEAGLADELLVVEDDAGAWRAAFAVDATPATVLVAPSGGVVWRGGGDTTGRELVDAVARHAAPGGEIAVNRVGVAVRPGARPPDVPLGLADGSELSLRRLRGRPLVVTFFTSRSRPSLDQLSALCDLAGGTGPGAPLVVAVGDGEPPDRVAEIAKERGLPFLVLPDPDRRISRAFGVWCWPSTVWVGADLRVEAVDVGLAGGYSSPEPPAPPEPPRSPEPPEPPRSPGSY